MTHDDHDFADLLRSLERPRSPGTAVDARVEARMFRALAQPPVTGPDADESDRTTIPGRQPLRSAVLVAASLVVIVGGLVLVTRPAEPEPPAFGGSTIPTPPPSDPDSSADSASTLPPNVLGYQPFTSTGFGIGPPGADPESGAVLERVGEATTGTDGFLTSVRRVIGPDVSDFDVVIREDGSAVVPVDYLDPAAFGGTCTGGSVVLTVDSTETQTTDARCSGRTASITIDSAAGIARPDGAGDDAALLLPVSYTITVDGSTATRTVTLWHDGDDLARIEPAEPPNDLESSTTDGINPEETP